MWGEGVEGIWAVEDGGEGQSCGKVGNGDWREHYQTLL